MEERSLTKMKRLKRSKALRQTCIEKQLLKAAGAGFSPIYYHEDHTELCRTGL